MTTEEQSVEIYHPKDILRLIFTTRPDVTLTSIVQTFPGTKGVKRFFPLPVKAFVELTDRLAEGKYQAVGRYSQEDLEMFDLWDDMV